MKKWWFSCKSFTVQVETDERRVITKAAPIVRKFLGQPLENLERWQQVRAVPLFQQDKEQDAAAD